MKPLSDNKSQVVIYVEEKSQQCPNEIKRILATEVSNYLNQATVKPQLTNMAIEQALALVVPDEDQLKEYLENPPKGIDPRMWKQAKIDNPDSQKFIPVPMIGFNELKWRIKCQEKETEAHNQYLSKVEKDLTELKQRHAATTARIMEYRRKLAELSHRILKVHLILFTILCLLFPFPYIVHCFNVCNILFLNFLRKIGIFKLQGRK